MSPNRRWSIVRVLIVVSFLGILACVGLMMPGHFQGSQVHAQTGLGGPLTGITSLETTLFDSGQLLFVKLWDPLHGLGPVFTQHGCAACHSQPVPGGNSLQFATLFGKTNPDGSFNPLTNEGGPLLQKLSISKFQPTCVLSGEQVPLDATIVAKHMTPPAYGVGLINSIDDNAILANAVDMGDGIHGMANMVADEHGVVRVGHFGRKAQFADLIQVAGQAFTHDLGITNPLFPDEDLPQGQPIPPNCAVASEPNDPDGSQVMATFHYLEYLAPSTPGSGNSNGQALFTSVGCAKCHVPTYTTDPMVIVALDLNGNQIISKALSNQTVTLYSDLLLHDMGPGLADNFPMGEASGSQWKTVPLWGLSLRSSYLHDGRTTDLTTAIKDHGGEASIVIQNFNALSPSDQDDLLAFLKSL